MERSGFVRLIDRLEPGDMLVVTKMDRLGRNAVDVMATIERLGKMSIRVKSLYLGDTDLTSAAGRMTTGILNVVAQFERDLLVERTKAGIDRARSQGERLGRPTALTADQRGEVVAALENGAKIAPLARRFGTIQRIRDDQGASDATARKD